MAKRLRILHVSDLHVGKERPADGWRVERVMGEAWARNLAEIRGDGQIDLVCFTGDLAQKGHADEYAAVREVIDALLQSVGCPRERFFCVPGNHDIDRGIAPDVWSSLRELQWHDPHGLSRWMAGGSPSFRCDPQWRDGILQRQQAYRGVLSELGLPHLLPGQHGNPHPHLGYRRMLEVGAGAPLHIIGFDSAWLAGDDNDAGKLRLTDDQIGRLMTGADGKPLPGWRIGLIHHPLTDLADARDAQRLLGQYGLDLLLHGHQHDPLIERWSDPQTGLHVFAAGCLYEHPRYPNGLLVVDVELPETQPLRPRQVWARKWSHRRSEWIDDDELYRGTRSGRLQLDFHASAHDPLNLDPGVFVGRETQLEQLRIALLPETDSDPKPTVVEGMPGAGKSRLVEEFVRRHWLPAQGVMVDGATTLHVPRLELRLDDARDANALGRELADILKLAGSDDSLWYRLREGLQSGPDGRPRLLRVDNVDGPTQASAAAELAAQLRGCAMVFTARQHGWTGAGWARVPTPPLPLSKAIELLQEKVREIDPQWVPDDGLAGILANDLGRLPLALHIAASHLANGIAVKEYVEIFHAEKLALEHAHPDGVISEAEKARRNVRSSFEISWKLWCAGEGAVPALQTGLVALAQTGIDSLGDELGAALTECSAADYSRLLVGARRLGLLELEAVRHHEDAAPRRRLRLHPLMVEFLRDKPGPGIDALNIRLNQWILPKIVDTDEATMRASRDAVLGESAALQYWLACADLEIGESMLGRRTEFAVACGPYGAWLECFERWYRACFDDRLRAGLCMSIAHVAERMGDLDKALGMSRVAVKLLSGQQDDRSVAIAQSKIADILFVRGDLSSALCIHRDEILPVVDRLGDLKGRAITQGRIAQILLARGDLEGALRIRQEEQVPIYEKIGDLHSLARAKGKVTEIMFIRGEFDAALKILREEQMPFFERMGDIRERAVTQDMIANILQARGDIEEALRIRREEVLPVVENLGDSRLRAITLAKIAQIIQLSGESEEALRIYRDEILPVITRMGDTKGCAVTYGMIADIMQEQGEFDEAIRIRRESVLPIYERMTDIRELLVGRANLALNLHERGRPEDHLEIRHLLDQALGDAERLRLPEAEAIRGWIAQIFGPRDEAAAPP